MHAQTDHASGHGDTDVGRPTGDRYSFKRLVQAERDWIDGQAAGSARTSADFRVSSSGPADEPWVWFTSRDSFGIALSGGGIRSATFNLGLLQSLEQSQVLRCADYISTVSGGGYVGGFLTSWQHHHGSGTAFSTRADPPSAPAGAPRDVREPPPIRHLREYSRFLMPRTGVFHAETWNAVVTILGGLLPSLITAWAVLLLGAAAWLAIAASLGRSTPSTGGLLIGAVTVAGMLWADWRQRRLAKGDFADTVAFAIYGGLTAIAVAFLWMVVGYRDSHVALGYSVEELSDLPATDTLLLWLHQHFDLWSSHWLKPGTQHATMGGAYAPAVAWLGVVIVLLFVRAVQSRFVEVQATGGTNSALKTRVNWSATTDRVITTCLVLALAWAALATLWFAARLLNEQLGARVSAGALGGGAAGLGGLFAVLRDWLRKPAEETRGGALLQKLITFVQPRIPQLLALAAVLVLATAMCLVLHRECGLAQPVRALAWTTASAITIVVLTLFFFDPARVGMHDFYRARICRCFLGAAHATTDNLSRFTAEQPGDDLRLAALVESPPAPRPGQPAHRTLHLVCCTANNLSGDVLGSLYRGGRSAVLSAHGVSIGNYHASLEALRLSSALTASAAAFNSQMGRLSIDLGPAVAFMMSALNLRLGLWVPHPLNPKRGVPVMPGLPFFYEMFGWTNADIPPERRSATGAISRVWQGLEQKSHYFRDLHLSDGGHFENLGLYELVRRHCRYIIVADCGADPQMTFDDLAIALRTIREDFGVEIELDVSPLRPDAGRRARQHAVVGTIHYDGPSGFDKGTLLYFKPVLTGDEPPDVTQFQARNEAFPHESTGDQFYDEAQWESYRRLGLHAGNVVLHFIERFKHKERTRRFIENVFLEAGRTWHPAPMRQSETFLALTQRCADIENEIRENAPAFLRAEFFPEIAALERHNGAAAAAVEPTPEAETQALYFLLLVAQVMEDVWIGAELDTYWSHPLNDGWMNYFQRWASTLSFRRWWPILRPFFGIGFRDFVHDRFGLRYDDTGQGGGPQLTLQPRLSGGGLAWNLWRQRHPGAVPAGQRGLEYWLTLDPKAAQPRRLLVGILLYHHDPHTRVISWRSEDLFVPPALNGAGITARFLNAVIEHFRAKPYSALHAIFEASGTRMNPAARLQRLQQINFYKSRGFTHPAPATDSLRLVLPLPVGGIVQLALAAAHEAHVSFDHAYAPWTKPVKMAVRIQRKHGIRIEDTLDCLVQRGGPGRPASRSRRTAAETPDPTEPPPPPAKPRPH